MIVYFNFIVLVFPKQHHKKLWQLEETAKIPFCQQRHEAFALVI